MMTPRERKAEEEQPEEEAAVQAEAASEEKAEEMPAPQEPPPAPEPPAEPVHPLLGGEKREYAPGADGDRIWAVIAHGSALLTVLFGLITGGALCLVGPFVPLVIWLVFRDRSPFVSRQALQATLFQALVVVVTVVLGVIGGLILAGVWTASAALVQAVVGICCIPLALVLTLVYILIVVGLPVAALVYSVYGAYEVSQGRDFNYWLIGDWVK